jgi:hypothetical protein
MSLRLRVGPFSFGTSGLVGVRVGPVSWYGGGTRRQGHPGRKVAKEVGAGGQHVKTSWRVEGRHKAADLPSWFVFLVLPPMGLYLIAGIPLALVLGVMRSWPSGAACGAAWLVDYLLITFWL